MPKGKGVIWNGIQLPRRSEPPTVCGKCVIPTCQNNQAPYTGESGGIHYKSLCVQHYYELHSKPWRQKNAVKAKKLRHDSYQRQMSRRGGEVRERNKLWAKKNPDRLRANWAVSAHKRRDRIGVKTISTGQWKDVLRRSKGRCYWCKKKPKSKPLEMDHVIPLSRGGEHSITNVVPACGPCNRSKGASIIVLL